MGVSNFSNGGTNKNGAAKGGMPTMRQPTDPTSLMINLNAKKHKPTLYRDKVILQLTSVVIGESKPNPLLMGPAGVGKTAVVEEFAARIQRKDPTIPEILHGYTVWSLQVSNLMAGSGIVGELENKVNQLIEFLSDPSNKAILFLDEIHLLFSNDMYKKIAQMLKPAMSRGDIKVIGASTTQEMKIFDTDPAFNRRFTKIRVDELSKEQTLKILSNYAEILKEHYNTSFNYDDILGKIIVDTADEMCSAGSHRPDNALTLFDRTVADAVIRKQRSLHSKNEQIRNGAMCIPGLLLTENGIKRTAFKLATGTSTPKTFDEAKIRERLSVIEGQDDVLERIIKTIRLYDMHLRPSKRPLTFLFAGSSGVGKTEVAKILAETYINEKPIILNMTEYTDESTINKIIGSPSGFVGYEDNIEMPFDILDTNPYQIILLDEFEKCHRCVQRLFMSVFDEGYMKTNRGKIIDFSKTIIIATTNAACTNSEHMGLIKSAVKDEKTVDDLSAFFDVELINRLRHRITFNKMPKDVYEKIMAHYYERAVTDMMARRPSLQLPGRLDVDTLNRLVDETYNPKTGARPIADAINEYIDDLVYQAMPSAPAYIDPDDFDFDDEGNDTTVISENNENENSNDNASNVEDEADDKNLADYSIICPLKAVQSDDASDTTPSTEDDDSDNGNANDTNAEDDENGGDDDRPEIESVPSMVN